jgi:chloramphenicol 3-O phosphotransferase
VDEVLLDRETLVDWLRALKDASVFFVGVRCDFQELRRREAARPDRAQGHMQTHFAAAHAHGDYDLEVDTTDCPTSRCAEAIISALGQGADSTAFERLRARAPDW